MKFKICLSFSFLYIGLYGQVNLDVAEQISLEEHIHSKYDVEQIFMLKSQKVKQWGVTEFEWKVYGKEYKRNIKIGRTKYSVKLFEESTIDLYFASIVNRDGALDSIKSFYFTIKPDSVILYNEERKRRISEAASPIHKYQRMGYKIISSSSSGNTSIVTMKNGNSYVTLTLYKGKVKSRSRYSL